MPAVQTLGRITALEPGWTPALSYGSLQMYDQYAYDYEAIYRTQSNVRTVIDFLARNIAQLGLHVFRRVSDTDRERLTDHPLAVLLGNPNPFTTRYRLIESLMIDLGIFYNAYWLKLRNNGNLALLRVPPQIVKAYGTLIPTQYEVSLSRETRTFEPSEVVHFRGHNPANSVAGLSPMETLRRILAEEHAMGDYREYFWRNAARMHGVLERPAGGPEWSTEARARFKAEFEELYSGGPNSGKTAILEEGMTWKKAAFSAEESEYLAGRKLTREEVARGYHVPLPMVGILEHATFSNIKEQHKNLYQDSLGPWLKMVEEEIELQLLPEFESRGVYVEFNIAEKLAGSFEEQTKSLQSAVGRPYMTANEARARMNLPRMPGNADVLVVPLNVLVGGQASPRDTAPPKVLDLAGVKAEGLKAEGELDPTLPAYRERHQLAWQKMLVYHFRRQEKAMLSRTPAKASIGEVWPDAARWNKELENDFYALNFMTAMVWARWVVKQIDAEVNEDGMLNWLRENSRIAAEEINATTRDQVANALTLEKPKDEVGHVFELAATVRAPEIAASKVNTAANFGAQEGAKAGGMRTKTWQVNSTNPRDAHAALNGQKVGIGELFSNGMLWPGDPAGGAANNANCQCSVRFGR